MTILVDDGDGDDDDDSVNVNADARSMPSSNVNPTPVPLERSQSNAEDAVELSSFEWCCYRPPAAFRAVRIMPCNATPKLRVKLRVDPDRDPLCR